MRRLSLFVFLIVGVVIGLGAFGHGHAVQKVHAAIDQFPIDPVIATTLYIVWYFVSGCTGDVSSLFVAYLIGALYVVTGVGGMIYRHGDLFWAFFIVLGGLLLVSSLALRSGNAPITQVERGARVTGA